MWNREIYIKNNIIVALDGKFLLIVWIIAKCGKLVNFVADYDFFAGDFQNAIGCRGSRMVDFDRMR